jgi:hypothetical protein
MLPIKNISQAIKSMMASTVGTCAAMHKGKPMYPKQNNEDQDTSAPDLGSIPNIDKYHNKIYEIIISSGYLIQHGPIV